MTAALSLPSSLPAGGARRRRSSWGRACTLAAALASSFVVGGSFGACSTTGGASLIAVGARAPSFRAPDQTGAVRTLEEFRGRPLVVFFYPKDGTPGCTKEACAFRDAWKAYEARGTAIVGISTDDVAAHARFAAEHQLPFPLLADADGAIARAWGVGVTFGIAQRQTVLVDGQGVVVKTWPDVDPGVHAAEILAAVPSSPSTAPAP